MNIKKTKLITLLLAGAVIFSTSLSVQAFRIVHSGTNCSAANQAQANEMKWSKHGLINNSNGDLYVICPIDVAAHHWDATPEIEVGVSVWMPPNYGSRFTPGPWCAARIMWSSALFGSNKTGEFATLKETASNIGNFNPRNLLGPVSTATNGDDAREELIVTVPVALKDFLDDAESAELFSVNLLCSIPGNGGRLVSYHGYQK